MKIVIDIPPKAYETIKDEKEIDLLGVENILDCIKNGTPIEEPIVRGKWLNVSKSVCDDYLGNVNYAECSVCHSIRVADYFCSCCGADMRKMEEGEKEE